MRESVNLSHSVILKIGCCAFPKHQHMSHPGHSQLTPFLLHSSEGHFSISLDAGSSPLVLPTQHTCLGQSLSEDHLQRHS